MLAEQWRGNREFRGLNMEGRDGSLPLNTVMNFSVRDCQLGCGGFREMSPQGNLTASRYNSGCYSESGSSWSLLDRGLAGC